MEDDRSHSVTTQRDASMEMETVSIEVAKNDGAVSLELLNRMNKQMN